LLCFCRCFVFCLCLAPRGFYRRGLQESCLSCLLLRGPSYSLSPGLIPQPHFRCSITYMRCCGVGINISNKKGNEGRIRNPIIYPYLILFMSSFLTSLPNLINIPHAAKTPVAAATFMPLDKPAPSPAANIPSTVVSMDLLVMALIL